MIDDRRTLDLLSDVLAAPPRVAPEGLLVSVLDDVAVTAQRGRRIPTFPPRMRARRSSPWRLAVAAVVVCVVASVAFAALSPLSGIVVPPAATSPAPSPTTTPDPSRTPFPATVMDTLTHLEPGVTYTSDRFQPRMTFKVNPRSPGTVGDEWCTPIATSVRLMIFAHAKSCRDDLRVIRPSAVECGTPDAHPDADTLATAILSNPRMASAVDLGTLQAPGAVPAGMFAADYHGRVVQIPARFAPFVGGQSCRLLGEPDDEQPVLEITGDLGMRLVLVDVHGELVVFRSRGDDTRGASEFLHLLSINHDIRFD